MLEKTRNIVAGEVIVREDIVAGEKHQTEMILTNKNIFVENILVALDHNLNSLLTVDRCISSVDSSSEYTVSVGHRSFTVYDQGSI